MKKNDVKVGGTYTARVSDKLVQVRIDGENRHGGWDGTNLLTGKKVRIKSAQRLRLPVRGTQAGAETKAAKDDGQTKATKATKGASKAKADKPADPNRCATPRCKGEPVITHIGKPLCQKCWDRRCQAEADLAELAAMSRKTPEAGDESMEAATTPAVNPTVEIIAGQPVSTPKKKAMSSGAPSRPLFIRAKKGGESQPKRLSALDAAAQVLKDAGKPMRAQELIEVMAAKDLWSSPNGQTPHATLYAAMMREARDKGTASRFHKVERGQFEFNTVAAK